ncbi:PREDICTED: DNA repair protein XRCC3-like isoform X2 [Nicrophorus vespilloides]|uniref:DNA repair protein XRCC3-like isoform X2 n=1 Tax=Nicrophorus vespilloides TaxID=110193 RepID=A0ABM1NEX4_NICVS|nr:PREDICTED: DNA repair protein XRCC3-like isoform X2 [Nicrophorus vespilloides]
MDFLKEKLPEKIAHKLSEVESIKEILISEAISLHKKYTISIQESEHLQKIAAEVVIGDRIKDGIEDCLRLRTGCAQIDDLTRGGFRFKMINEVYGEAGVGKTQLCLQLAVAVQMPPISGAAFYVCTDKSFPANRLLELSLSVPSAFGLSGDESLMDKVFVEHSMDFIALRRLLFVKLPKLLENVRISLVVIDSIAAIFRSEDIKYLERSKEIDDICRQLNHLARTHNLVVVCVNQVTDDPNSDTSGPSLGNAWANYVVCRFLIERDWTNGIRRFRVVNAPYLKPDACRFIITQSGLH